MKERLAAIVTVLSLLLAFVLVQPAAAQNQARTRTPTPTPARPTPTPAFLPLFIDTASEGYPCSNGVCAFPSGNVSTGYDAPITSGGGQGGRTWSVVAGSLPAGLFLTPSYGVYSAYVYGTPTTVQTSTFTLQVQDAGGHTARQAFTLKIDPTPPPTVSYPNPCCPSGTVGTPYGVGFFVSGGVRPYTWSISSGQIPPGLSLDCPSPPASLDGLPTTAGTFTFALTVTDGQGKQGSEQGSITIQPASPASSSFSLSFSPVCVRGGGSSTGTVILGAPAPSGGAVVPLFNNNTAVVTVPSSVTVPAGATSARFTASTKPVSSYISVQLAASYDGQDQWAVLSVSPS